MKLPILACAALTLAFAPVRTDYEVVETHPTRFAPGPFGLRTICQTDMIVRIKKGERAPDRVRFSMVGAFTQTLPVLSCTRLSGPLHLVSTPTAVVFAPQGWVTVEVFNSVVAKTSDAGEVWFQ